MRLALAALQRYVVRGGWLNQFSTIRERQWLQTSPDATDLGIAKVVSLESGPLATGHGRAQRQCNRKRRGDAFLPPRAKKGGCPLADTV